jgi:hypothetical protein
MRIYFPSSSISLPELVTFQSSIFLYLCLSLSLSISISVLLAEIGFYGSLYVS